MAEALTLSRDHTCVRGMNWRCDVAPAAVDTLLAALTAAGFSPRPSPAAMPTLRSPEGHHVLIVRRTGRVQIRVDYAVPEPLRRFSAEAVFAVLVRALASGPAA